MADTLTSFGELKHGLLSDQIYELIVAMIKDGRLAPGEQLVELQLAKRLGVSQAPVRDALRKLQHDGLVHHVRHQGSFVAQYSDEEVAQAKFARAELEAIAGRLTCGHLTPALRTRLVELITAMHDAADAQDLSQFRELDFAFHRSVVEGFGNVFLLRMWDVLEPSLRSLHVLADPGFTGDWHEVAEWHRRLVDVLDGDDPEAAAALFRSHAAGTLLDGEGAQTR